MASTHNFFISDLHLNSDQAQLNQLFSDYCQQLLTWCQTQVASTTTPVDSQQPLNLHHPEIKTQLQVRLFILGDFLALALGDDLYSWFKPYAQQLCALADYGVQLFFTIGNRDFFLQQNFCKQIKATYVEENAIITLHDQDLDCSWRQGQAYLNQQFQPTFPTKHTSQTPNSLNENAGASANFNATNNQQPTQQHSSQGLSILLCHGDNLCLSDRGYLEFRKFIRRPFIHAAAKVVPMLIKNGIGYAIRQKSKKSQRQYQSKNPQQSPKVYYTDIDVPYSMQLLQANQAQIGIFGHIHKQRLLLQQALSSSDTITPAIEQLAPVYAVTSLEQVPTHAQVTKPSDDHYTTDTVKQHLEMQQSSYSSSEVTCKLEFTGTQVTFKSKVLSKYPDTSYQVIAQPQLTEQRLVTLASSTPVLTTNMLQQQHWLLSMADWQAIEKQAISSIVITQQLVTPMTEVSNSTEITPHSVFTVTLFNELDYFRNSY